MSIKDDWREARDADPLTRGCSYAAWRHTGRFLASVAATAAYMLLMAAITVAVGFAADALVPLVVGR